VDFDLSPEQEAMRRAVLSFAGERLADHHPGAEELRGALATCATVGLTGLTIGTDWGGEGADPVTAVVALEALGEGCADNGLIFALNAHLWSAATAIERFGTDDQRRRFLPALCRGELVGGQAMTEPESGSDAFALATRAEPTDDGYTLTGSKLFVTNAPVADVLVVYATLDPSAGWAGLTAFLVERDRPGLAIGRREAMMGLDSAQLAEVRLDRCAVPAENVLGPVGAGMAVFNHSMEAERGYILAAGVGTMARQLDDVIEYATSREQFGRPIGSFQAVSHRIVDMRVRLDAARLLLYRMAWLKQQGRKAAAETAIVKLFVAESWLQASLDELQVHGAHGYVRGAAAERNVRDAIASRIYSGTSEIQRNLIAHELGL
jgi:alkylation response protein AidB-like acyl-CoA dehydrogenase